MKTKLISMAFIALLFAGCRAPLAPSGVYAGDKVLYEADSTIGTSYQVIDQFLKFERDNRQALSATPQVKQYADTLRQQSPGWFQSAIALRDAYAANPSPGARDALTTALAVLRQAVTEATKQLTRYSAIGLPPPITNQLPPLPPTR